LRLVRFIQIDLVAHVFLPHMPDGLFSRHLGSPKVAVHTAFGEHRLWHVETRRIMLPGQTNENARIVRASRRVESSFTDLNDERRDVS
jgi:hypothetical protein